MQISGQMLYLYGNSYHYQEDRRLSRPDLLSFNSKLHLNTKFKLLNVVMTNTFCLLKPGRYEHNAQWILSNLVTEIRVIGCVQANQGLQLQCVVLPPTHEAAASTVPLLPTYCPHLVMRNLAVKTKNSACIYF